MAQPLRIENPDEVQFVTCRTAGSRLLFSGSKKLQLKILGYLAKYIENYGVVLHAFIFMGNHYHMVARFPRSNKSDFMRSFNSRTAVLVGSLVKEVESGKIWGRRYSAEALPNNQDVEQYSFYTWLNPVSSGLVERIADYDSYNSFSECAYELKKEYEVVDWTRFNNHRRSNPNAPIKNYIQKFVLNYHRLPGYEDVPKQDYTRMLLTELERRRVKLVEDRIDSGGGFPKKEKIWRTSRGSRPKTTKKSSRSTRRPLVLTLCAVTRRLWKARYYAILAAYKVASRRYRAGEIGTTFPAMTYKPLLMVPTRAPM